MKRTFLFIALAAACINVVAANLQVNQTNVKRTWAISSSEAQEYAPEGWTPGIDATIDFPTGNDKLSQTVIKWMAKSLGVSTIVYNNAEELIDAYTTNVKENEGSDMTIEFTLTKVFETNELVSYEMQGYDYNCGAAHGMPYCHGVTFRKSDCKDMSDMLVKKNARISHLLKKGLKAYFDVSRDQQLAEILFDGNLPTIKAPSNSPWVVKGGIMFQYGAYEIAPFAAGMPEALISIRDITPYLTPDAAKCLKPSRR